MGNRWGSHKQASAAAAKEKDKDRDAGEKDKARARGWSISSLRRGSRARASIRRMSWVPRPHMDCGAWLGALELPQYAANFQHFAGVEDFLYCDEASVIRLGVSCPRHRARIMASLAALRDKYEKNHKLKGVDVKPRISLVEDGRDHSCSSDFISVIHTPLPPTPTSYSPTPSHSPYKSPPSSESFYSPVRKQSTTPSISSLHCRPQPPTTVPTSTSINNSLYSPVRKQPPPTTLGSPLLTPTNFNSSFKKTSISSDSLLNSNSPLSPFSNPQPFSPNSPSSLNQTRHSNLSISNRHNSISSESNPSKSFSSNPNILSPTSPVQPHNSPTSPSYSTRSSNNPHINIPILPSRSNSIRSINQSNNLNHYPKHPSSNNNNNSVHINNCLNQQSPTSANSQNFSRSYSTRAPSSRDFSPAGTPTSPLSRAVSIGYASPKSPTSTIALDDSEDVILRQHPSTQRRDHRKRAAGLLSPSSIAKMSFNYDSGMSLEAADSEDLSHLLEWELSLDSGDLRSHAWYHGNIPRARAEEIVQQEGAFLVRDCTTQPGNFVLTCFWELKLLHFVIQKTVVQPDTVYERVQYELEDDAYDTIPDLICAYVGNKRVVTKATGAKILTPVNRSKPLSYYESLYKREVPPTPVEGVGGNRSSAPPGRAPIPRTYDNRQPVSTPVGGVSCSIVRSAATDLLQQQQAPLRSRPSLEGGAVDDRSNSSDGIISHRPPKDLSASTQSLPRRMHGGKTELSLPPTNTLSGSDSTGELQKPPPKPSRVPSFKVKARKPQIHVTDRVYAEIDEKEEEEGDQESEDKPSSLKSSEHQGSPGGSSTAGSIDQNSRFSRLSEVYQPSGSDSGNGSGDSIQTTASDARNRDSQGSLVDESALPPLEDDSLAEEPPLFILPEEDPQTSFQLETFSTFLLPHAENPPLDATALNGVRNTILETGSRILAAHLTYADLEVLNGLPTQDFGLGVTMGIEVVTLPQGSQLRKDLIERTECMRLLVAVTVLKADDIRIRAELIHRWIQIAIDTKTATGNLYGFNNIMLGLCNPQIQRLTATWHMVRQKFTDSAFNFESKLRSTLKAMNECSNPQAPNTVIPHLLPFVMLCERDLEDIYTLRRKDESLLQWESTTSDYGLQMLLLHLQEGRNFAQNLPIYRRNAELILDDPENLEDLILDVFRTEFHLKFLFGSRGALRDSHERHTKFHQILSALSAHCESAVESSV